MAGTRCSLTAYSTRGWRPPIPATSFATPSSQPSTPAARMWVQAAGGQGAGGAGVPVGSGALHYGASMLGAHMSGNFCSYPQHRLGLASGPANTY